MFPYWSLKHCEQVLRTAWTPAGAHTPAHFRGCTLLWVHAWLLLLLNFQLCSISQRRVPAPTPVLACFRFSHSGCMVVLLGFPGDVFELTHFFFPEPFYLYRKLVQEASKLFIFIPVQTRFLPVGTLQHTATVMNYSDTLLLGVESGLGYIARPCLFL